MYLPEGAGVYSLGWFLNALRSTLEYEVKILDAIPRGRPPDTRNSDLANSVASVFVEHLDCPLLVGVSTSRPFLRILRAIFDCLDLTGKKGEPVTDKTLALYASHAARQCPFEAD